jgi:hypothetical protein
MNTPSSTPEPFKSAGQSPGTKTAAPKPTVARKAEATLAPRQWVPIVQRKGWAKIPNTLKAPPQDVALYRLGVSYPPQPIAGTGTPFDGMTMHVLAMSKRHVADDTKLREKSIIDVASRLIESGWAACVRQGKQGRKSVAVIVFLTDEQRARLYPDPTVEWPKLTDNQVAWARAFINTEWVEPEERRRCVKVITDLWRQNGANRPIYEGQENRANRPI